MSPSSRDGVVLVGGGPAAWSCAFELRARGYDGRLTLVCGEGRPPYDRTMVSKDCLDREPQDRELSLSSRDAYAHADIEVRLGVHGTALDPIARRVMLDDGDALPYEALLIATGGRPFVPPALACPGIHTLRSHDDARRLFAALGAVRTLAIVGGGFIAGEVATVARARGIDVVMLEALEGPLVRVVGAEVSARVAELHRAAGVDLRLRAGARRVIATEPGFIVEVVDGSAFSADAVVVATGMSPAIEWLRDTPGLVLDGGIVTDERCRTPLPDVYAAGDCARWLDRRSGHLARVEHWDTAVRHGKAAAGSIVGDDAPFVPVPFVWSMQHGHRLQWVGDGTGWDHVQVAEHGDSAGLVARYLRGGELCAGFAIDAPRATAAMRRELTDLYRAEVVAAE